MKIYKCNYNISYHVDIIIAVILLIKANWLPIN